MMPPAGEAYLTVLYAYIRAPEMNVGYVIQVSDKKFSSKTVLYSLVTVPGT